MNMTQTITTLSLEERLSAAISDNDIREMWRVCYGSADNSNVAAASLKVIISWCERELDNAISCRSGSKMQLIYKEAPCGSLVESSALKAAFDCAIEQNDPFLIRWVYGKYPDDDANRLAIWTILPDLFKKALAEFLVQSDLKSAWFMCCNLDKWTSDSVHEELCETAIDHAIATDNNWWVQKFGDFLRFKNPSLHRKMMVKWHKRIFERAVENTNPHEAASLMVFVRDHAPNSFVKLSAYVYCVVNGVKTTNTGRGRGKRNIVIYPAS